MKLLKSFLDSKRAQATGLAILTGVLGHLFKLPPDLVNTLWISFLALAGFFAAGDWGKEAAKINAAA